MPPEGSRAHRPRAGRAARCPLARLGPALLGLVAALACGAADEPADVPAGPAPTAPAAAGGSLLETGRKLYSQNDEELIIRDFFADRRGGFFVDVGCYEYERFSTTYYLEKHLGWTGIGIDANDALRAGYEAHRPGTVFEHYVVTDTSGGEHTFYLSVGSEGISSVSRRWIDDFLDEYFPQAEPEIREVKVPAITLDDLLTRHGVERIDFLSMDIEGHEPAALAGFDIERFAPELVCIEAPADPAPILDYFTGHGYERIDRYLAHDPVNWYFRPRPDPPATPAPTGQ